MMGGMERIRAAAVVLATAGMAVAYASQASAGDGADPFGNWGTLEGRELLQQSRGGTDKGDKIDIGSHNVDLTNENELKNINAGNKINNSNGSMNTGFGSNVVHGNRGFTTVISNTGHQNNFMSNYTVNLYLK